MTRLEQLFNAMKPLTKLTNKDLGKFLYTISDRCQLCPYDGRCDDVGDCRQCWNKEVSTEMSDKCYECGQEADCDVTINGKTFALCESCAMAFVQSARRVSDNVKVTVEEVPTE